MGREPLLILTGDDLLAERWQSLGDVWIISRGRTADDLYDWAATGSRLALVDLGLGGAVPIWRTPAWGAAVSNLILMAATSRPADKEGLELLQAGASGYCHAYAAPAQLRQAMDVIASGELWVGRSLLMRLLHSVDARLPNKPAPAWVAQLTEREWEVAQLTATGLSNLEMANRLGITERTIKAHLKAVFEKSGVNDRLQLALRVHGVS